MSINNKNYELMEERNIADLNSVGYILRHKKSGARVVLLSNDDDNKVFNIGFRTPPYNDGGLPHILEHSVLCGSKKYPTKDPFVELCKGSLNTFLNAMTYPDKTVYPVASCNAVDFMNIVDVYMDAVFNPNIYVHEEIFRQEGWHYEMENADGPITYNGVVYNEMKGAFSDPDDLLNSVTFRTLFPDNEYGNESGGNPANIPELTYEEFLEFHKKYYHPSNSYIYAYGDMDMEEFLTYLDENYLCKYDEKNVDSAIKEQKAFTSVKDVTEDYAVTEEEGTEDNTYLSYNAVVGTSLDDKMYLAMQIIDYALISAPGAPLKQALIDAGIGDDVYCSYENSIYQPMFSIVAKGANEEQKEEFLKIIREQFTKAVEQGIDEKALLAGINYYEFKYREADFGSFPKGLMYGLQMMDSWLYDDSKPFIHIECNDNFAFLKANMKTGYYEDLIKRYILDNTHAAMITLRPVIGLTAKQEEATAKKLEEYKKTLSKDEIAHIVDYTKHLKAYQEEPSTQEELETIPMLSREDIGREPAKLYMDEKESKGVKIIHSNLFTNGIAYMTLSFDCNKVPEKLMPYIGLLQNVLEYIDTDEHSYSDLFNEIHINCGGLSTGSNVYTNDKTFEYQIRYELRAKTLYDKMGYAFDTFREIMLTSHFDDEKRMKEILGELKSRLQSRISNSGHTAAISETMGQFSPSIYYTNMTSGIGFYRFIEDLEKNFEERKSELQASLKELTRLLFNRENLLVHVTIDEDGYDTFVKALDSFVAQLSEEKLNICPREYEPKKKKIGYMTSSQVNYVARCGNYVKSGYEYNGALRILKTIFSYDYLWINVRVKGGAYGCMSGFYKNGDSYMVSYRDPNLKETNEIYENAVDYVRNFSVSDRDMTKYVIGTIGGMDTPMGPSAKGTRSFSAYLSGVGYEDFQKTRNEVIDATANDIRNLYSIVQAMLSEDYFTVIGNEQSIKANKEMFDEIVNLF